MDGLSPSRDALVVAIDKVSIRDVPLRLSTLLDRARSATASPVTRALADEAEAIASQLDGSFSDVEGVMYVVLRLRGLAMDIRAFVHSREAQELAQQQQDSRRQEQERQLNQQRSQRRRSGGRGR